MKRCIWWNIFYAIGMQFAIACLRSFAQTLRMEDSLSILVAEEQDQPLCSPSVNNELILLTESELWMAEKDY